MMRYSLLATMVVMGLIMGLSSLWEKFHGVQVVNQPVLHHIVALDTPQTTLYP